MTAKSEFIISYTEIGRNFHITECLLCKLSFQAITQWFIHMHSTKVFGRDSKPNSHTFFSIMLVGLYSHSLTHSLTHSLSWGLLENLPIVQLLKNFPAFCGTRRFITVFTRALHWSLSWARSIQSIPSHPISLRSILILSTHQACTLNLLIWVLSFLHNLAALYAVILIRERTLYRPRNGYFF
jgi:hypothetical protein